MRGGLCRAASVCYLLTLPVAAPASPLWPGSAAGETTGPISPEGSEKNVSENQNHNSYIKAANAFADGWRD